MGRRTYPPLVVSEVVKILLRRGFSLKVQDGSHAQYEGFIKGKRRIVTVDTGKGEFGKFLMQSMIRQSGMTGEEFYGATKKTAKRASVPHLVDLPEEGQE